MKQGLLTYCLIVGEYTLVFVAMLHLVSKRGNQEKSDKQINGGTKQLELVCSWSRLVLLFLSQCWEFNHLCVSPFTDPDMVTIMAAVYAAEQKNKKKSFRASHMGGI